jgi:DoxX-like family
MPDTTKSNRAVWIGRIASALVVVAVLVDGAMALFAPAKMANVMQETGFAMDLAPTLGGIMVACAVLYAIPATTVLGAILVTGFLGGAICAHVRLGELGSPPEIISVLLGVMTWGGLYLRDPRVRAILPLSR